MRSEEVPLGKRGDLLGRLIEEEAGKGRAVWASFDWTVDVDLDTALEQQERLSGLVDANQLVVKTAALEEAIGAWSPAALRKAQSLHSGTVLASESGLWLARATPMPPA